MIETAYRRRVALLLAVLPEVAREKCFALHGGTTINLFVREMPRLSVDIDLTYVLVEDRALSLATIREALGRIKASAEKAVRGAQVSDRSDIGKLLVTQWGVPVKLEVNLEGRGTLSDPREMPLCLRAQEEFDVFCAIQVVPMEQLYGGKICAALDRQHPRDLFDVKIPSGKRGIHRPDQNGIYLLTTRQRPPRSRTSQPELPGSAPGFGKSLCRYERGAFRLRRI
jgi:predicted nucleotidyltransferase component of viral defense system